MDDTLSALDSVARTVRHLIDTHPDAPIYADLGDHSLSTASAGTAHRRVHILPAGGQILVYAAERGGFDRHWLIGPIRTITVTDNVGPALDQAVTDRLAYIAPAGTPVHCPARNASTRIH